MAAAHAALTLMVVSLVAMIDGFSVPTLPTFQRSNIPATFSGEEVCSDNNKHCDRDPFNLQLSF